MSFKPISFAPSASVSAMAAGLAGSLQGLTQSFTDGAGALGDLGLPASGPGDLAGLVDGLRGQATEALAAPVNFLALTPFQFGVGARKGEYGYLTPEAALQTLAARCGDMPMPGEGAGENKDTFGLVGLMVAAQTPSDMGQALSAFNKVYPMPELEQACRRAQSLATLETDKFIIPEAPAFPPWGKVSPQMDPTGQAVSRALGGMLAAGEGMGMGIKAPGDMLAGFAQKQAAKLAGKLADLQALAEAMTGEMGGWQGFSLEGTPAALFKALGKMSLPFEPSFKCTSLLTWFGKPGEVAYYKETFGL